MKVQGGFDKMTMGFVFHIPISFLKERGESLGWTVKSHRLGSSKTWGVKFIDPKGRGFTFRLFHRDSSASKIMSAKLSSFESFSDFASTLIALVGRNDFEVARLLALELKLDFEMEFIRLAQSINVLFKQMLRTNIQRGCELTGLNYGRGEDIFSLYDKRKELLQKHGMELDHDLSRLEARLSGKALSSVIEYVRDLPRLLRCDEEGPLFRPFGRLLFRDVELVAESELASREDLIKWGQLKGLFNCVGFDGAKRFLNEHKHFKRDYGHLYREAPVDLDLDLILHQGLREFFQTEGLEKNTWMH